MTTYSTPCRLSTSTMPAALSGLVNVRRRRRRPRRALPHASLAAVDLGADAREGFELLRGLPTLRRDSPEEPGASGGQIQRPERGATRWEAWAAAGLAHMPRPWWPAHRHAPRAWLG